MKGIVSLCAALGMTLGATTSSAAEGWIPVGDATFMDGWVLPGLNLNQENPENWYKVPLERNNENSSLYRLVDPYHTGPAAIVNETDRTGYIEIDVSDPDHVVINRSMQEAGFACREVNVTEFYCYNMLSVLMISLNYTADEIIERVGEDGIPYTTFKNGVVSLGYITENGEKDYDANFGMQYDPYGGYTWQSDGGISKNMNTKIFFPKGYDTNGVTVVTDDAADGPIEYYTLDGVRIKEPTQGVYIMKKGTKTKKVIAR